MNALAFKVPGKAAPQGSKRAVKHKSTGNIVMMESNPKGHAAYRADIREAWTREVDARPGEWTMPATVALWVTFIMPRPQSHFRVRGALKDSAPKRPGGRPDIDKLLRSVMDALTGYAYKDDSAVVELHISKRYDDTASPHTFISIEVIDR